MPFNKEVNRRMYRLMIVIFVFTTLSFSSSVSTWDRISAGNKI